MRKWLMFILIMVTVMAAAAGAGSLAPGICLAGEKDGKTRSSSAERSGGGEKTGEEKASRWSEKKRLDEQKNKWLEEMVKQLDLEKMDDLTPEEFPEKLTFSHLVSDFVTGGGSIRPGEIAAWFFDLFFYEIRAEKTYFFALLLFAAVIALFRQLIGAKAGYVSDMSQLIMGMAMMIILMKGFGVMAEMAQGTIENLGHYLTVLVPMYATTLMISGNPALAAVYYEFSFLLMTLAAWAMKMILVPGIHLYLLLRLFDQLFEEERLSRLAELLSSIIKNVMKYAMAAVLGISCIQSVLGKAKDQLETDVVMQSVSAIPGVGDVLGASGNILLSCGAMVKNSVGVAAVVFLGGICLIPLIKVIIFVFLYRLLAAVLQPVADKRLVRAINSTAQAGKLYFLLLRDGAVMFMLTVAVITAAGG